jgi:hypothetical protein
MAENELAAMALLIFYFATPLILLLYYVDAIEPALHVFNNKK